MDCSSSSSDKCDAELEELTSVEACNLAQDKTGEIMKELSGLVNPLKGIIDALKSSADTEQLTVNKLRLNINTSSVLEQMSRCDNIIASSQSNILKGPSPECVQAWVAAKLPPEDIKKALTISNVTQENKNTIISVCQINQALDALTQMEASIDNQALQDAITQSKGIMAGTSVKQTSCSDINSNMSACKYLSQKQCCMSKITSNQENLIDSGCAIIDTVSQSNVNSVYNQCSLSSQSSASDALIGKILNKVDQKGDAKAEGVDTGFMIVIMIIVILIVGVMVGLPVIAGGSVINKIMPIIGILLFIIGLMFIVMYYFNKKESKSYTNKSIASCPSSKTQELTRTSYGEAKEKARTDKNIVGYDFLFDITNSDTLDSDKGAAAYITKVNDNCKPEDVEGKSRSFIKERKDKRFLVVGILLMVAGILQVAIVLLTRKSDKGVEDVIP